MKILKIENINLLNKVEKIFGNIFPKQYRAVITGPIGIYFLYGKNIEKEYPHINYDNNKLFNYIIENRSFFRKHMLLTLSDVILYEIKKCNNIINITNNTTDEKIKQILHG